MKIPNKKVYYQYKLEPERIEAGLVLSGGEAKAVRSGHADLSASYVKIIGREAFLINTKIHGIFAQGRKEIFLLAFQLNP